MCFPLPSQLRHRLCLAGFQAELQAGAVRDPQPLVKMWTARRNGPSHFMQSCIPALLFVQRLAKNHRAYTNLSRFSPRVLSFWCPFGMQIRRGAAGRCRCGPGIFSSSTARSARTIGCLAAGDAGRAVSAGAPNQMCRGGLRARHFLFQRHLHRNHLLYVCAR